MSGPEIRVIRERCVECGDCLTLCPQSGPEVGDPVLSWKPEGGVGVGNREGCTSCFTCVEYCRAAALVVHDESHAPDEQPDIFPRRPTGRIA